MELRAVTDIARLKASTLAGLVVIFGMIIASTGQPETLNLIMAFLLGFLISASTNTINDIMDYEIDIFDKPNRPIPRKGISVKEAKVIFVLETIIGLLIAIFLNFVSFLLSVSVSLLSVLYSYRLKNVLLVKNIITSFGISAALLVGVFASNPETVSNDILLFFLVIFIAVIAFEMHKDIADVEGDGKNNKNTLAVVFGTKKTAYIVVGLYILDFLIYHSIVLLTGFYFSILFWVGDIIIVIGLVPIFNLINNHEDIEYVHKTRKITMGVFMLIMILLIINFIGRVPT